MPTPTESVSTEALVEALRTLVREEVTSVVRASIEDTIAEAIAEIRATVAESGGGGGGLDKDQILALGPEFCSRPEFQSEISKQLEEAFQGVLPGLVKRLRGEIEKRLQTGEAAGGAAVAGGGASIGQVVNSNELKEVLEDRFRTMLMYLKTEVIPDAIKRGG